MFKYFDKSRYNKIFTISEDTDIQSYAQVADNKLAVMSQNDVCIYSLFDGSRLLSIKDMKELTKQRPRKLFYSENKYVFVYMSLPSEREHSLLVINLNSLEHNCHKMSVEREIKSLVYLENGTLILGGIASSTWIADSWPFTRISNEKAFKHSAHLLIALPGRCFASSSLNTVSIWNYDMELLNEFKKFFFVSDLKFLTAEFLLISSYSHEIIINYKTGDVLKDCRYVHKLDTIDNTFCILMGNNEVLVYFANGFFPYYNVKIPNYHAFFGSRWKILKDGTFAKNKNRSLKFFNFNL
jgi:hypothetical protein